MLNLITGEAAFCVIIGSVSMVQSFGKDILHSNCTTIEVSSLSFYLVR